MNPKNILYGGIVAVILLIAIFFVGKTYGKNTPPPAIPDPGDIDLEKGKFDPSTLTDRLYSDIDGLSNPFNRDMDAWNQLAALSDSDFAAVLNDWDKRYFKEWKETLYQSFKKEKFNPFTSANLLASLVKKFEKIEKNRPK